MPENTGRQAYTTSLDFLVENMHDAHFVVRSPAYRRLLESDVARTYGLVGGKSRMHDFTFLCDVIAFNDAMDEVQIEFDGAPQDKERRRDYVRAIMALIDRPQTQWHQYPSWEKEFTTALHRAHRDVDTQSAQRVYARLRNQESEEQLALDPLFLRTYRLLNNALPAVRKHWKASSAVSEERAILDEARKTMRQLNVMLAPYDGALWDTNRLDCDELHDQLSASAMLVLLKDDYINADKNGNSAFLRERVERFAPRVNKLPDGLKPYYHILRRALE